MISPHTELRVGFVGLGRMGKPMALNLVNAGFDVMVKSRSRDPIAELVAAGASEAESLEVLVNHSEVVCTCLPDVQTSEAVYLESHGLAQHARSGQVFIETSTIGPSLAKRTSVALASKQAMYLDAPISGGVERAISGKLTIMVGGEASALETARPVLEAMGASVNHAGKVGQGCVIKLTNQLLVAIHTLASCEAFLFGTEAGADPKQLLHVLGTSWGASNMLTRNGPMLIAGEYGDLAPTRLLVKDLGLIEKLAKELELELPIGHRTRQIFDSALDYGLGAMDISSLITMLQDQ